MCYHNSGKPTILASANLSGLFGIGGTFKTSVFRRYGGIVWSVWYQQTRPATSLCTQRRANSAKPTSRSTALVSSWLALSPSAIHPFRAVSYYIRRFIQYCHFALRGPIVVRKKKAIEQHIVGLNCTSHHFNASFINSFNIPGSPRRGPWFPGSYTTTYRLRCINDNDNKYKI